MTVKFKGLKLLLLIGLGLFILSSCDPGSNIKYSVVNRTSKPISIKYQFPDDSLVLVDTIAIDSNKIIYSENSLGYIDDINQRLDSIYFYSFILKQGDEISPINFKDKKHWKFIKNNDQNGTYLLTVDKSLFYKE